ncbi:MAG: DUF169 domain-containing protein [Firmicutes bacterium]|nr:DUF169 domain-containing protein [Bacillota bacterium]
MNVKENAKWLEILLDLKRNPVGVKFFLSKEEYDNFDAPENTNILPYCVVVKRASDGKCQKIHKGHSGCMGSAWALGLAEPTKEVLSGERRSNYGTYKDKGICRKISKNMVYCQHDTYGLAIMPLEAFKEEPDIVIIVTNPFNGMRIAQGYAYKHGHIENIKFSGMQAICQECTSLPYEESRINFSMLCAGTRMLANWKEDELGIGMPYRIFEDIIEGLKKTVNPLERNKGKKKIEQKIKTADLNLNDDFNIEYNSNYDDKVYKGGLVNKN